MKRPAAVVPVVREPIAAEYLSLLLGTLDELAKLPRVIPISGKPARIDVPATRIDDLVQRVRHGVAQVQGNR